MQILIFGATCAGMMHAVSLAQEGHQVSLVMEGSYPGEDLLGTFKAYADEQAREWINGFGGDSGAETPAQMKRTLLKRLLDARVQLFFYTRFAALLLAGGRACGALVMGPNECKAMQADLVIDATLLKVPSHQAAGAALLIPAGTVLPVRACVILEDETAELSVPAHVLACRDPVDRLRVHLQMDAKLPEAMTPTQAHLYVMKQRALLLEQCGNCGCDTAQPQLLETELVAPLTEIEGFQSVGEPLPMLKPNVKKADEVLLNGQRLRYDQGEGLTERHLQALPRLSYDVLVCGAGTAGVWAALYAAREGAQTLCVEKCAIPGGTRTVGGVSGLYCGNRSGLFQEMWEEIRAFADRLPGQARVDPVSEALFIRQAFEESNVSLRLAASLCAVWVKNRRIALAMIAGEDGVFAIEAKQYVDATGEGLLCHMAGCSWQAGESTLHMTQNHSQWSRCTPERRAYRPIDQDMLDSTQDAEWMRCAKAHLLQATEYDLFEQLTPRETRRIRGRAEVSLKTVARGVRWPDTVYDAYSTFDPHGRSFGLEGRLGALPALGKGRFAAIPLGALLPQELDGVLVTGKAISCTQEGSNFVRMNPDVMSIGAIAGKLAAQCVRRETDADRLDLRPLQAQLVQLGAMIQNAPAEITQIVSASSLAARILAGEDESAFNDAVLAKPEGLGERLRRAYVNRSASNLDTIHQLLLLYGDTSAAAEVTRQLAELDERCQTLIYSDRQRNTGVILGGVHGKADEYWRMNRMAVLLAHSGWKEAIPVLQSMLEHTVPGGAWHNRSSVYSSIRLDTNTVPNYDRILCLAHAIAEMPDPSFCEGLIRLTKATAALEAPSAQVWRDYLLLRLAQAFKACGGDAVRLLSDAGLNEAYAFVQLGKKQLEET